MPGQAHERVSAGQRLEVARIQAGTQRKVLGTREGCERARCHDALRAVGPESRQQVQPQADGRAALLPRSRLQRAVEVARHDIGGPHLDAMTVRACTSREGTPMTETKS